MLMTSLSPETLGASLSTATLGAALDVAGFLCLVVMVWAIFAFSMTTPLAPMQTAMTLLEADLAQVETFPALSTVSSSAAAAATATAAPVSATASTLESSTVVEDLRADLAAYEEQSGAPVERRDEEWPPAPIGRPGARRYRYVNVGGRLVKLSDLVEAAAWPPSKAMLN